MSQIEVPDWVAEAAEFAFCGTTEETMLTPEGSAVLREAMRAALTAALGAWVVPVGYASRKALASVSTPPFYGCDAYISAAEQTDVVCDRIYYLRQEKPE